MVQLFEVYFIFQSSCSKYDQSVEILSNLAPFDPRNVLYIFGWKINDFIDAINYVFNFHSQKIYFDLSEMILKDV